MFGLNLDKLKHEALIQATKIQLARLEKGLASKLMLGNLSNSQFDCHYVLTRHLQVDVEVLKEELAMLMAKKV